MAKKIDVPFNGTKEQEAKLRAALAEDLGECMYLSLKYELKYLKKRGGDLYPLTFQAYEFYKKTRRRK